MENHESLDKKDQEAQLSGRRGWQSISLHELAVWKTSIKLALLPRSPDNSELTVCGSSIYSIKTVAKLKLDCREDDRIVSQNVQKIPRRLTSNCCMRSHKWLLHVESGWDHFKFRTDARGTHAKEQLETRFH
jgi:hypothetical protein